MTVILFFIMILFKDKLKMKCYKIINSVLKTVNNSIQCHTAMIK